MVFAFFGCFAARLRQESSARRSPAHRASSSKLHFLKHASKEVISSMHEIFFPRSFLVFTHNFAFFSVPIAKMRRRRGPPRCQSTRRAPGDRPGSDARMRTRPDASHERERASSGERGAFMCARL